jgi:hypothetical protein
MIVNAPHSISTTPIYRVSVDRAIDNERSIKDIKSFFSRYEFANRRLRITNSIKRGSDHAITETVNNGIEAKIANVPMRAKTGKDDKYLEVSSPPKYTIKPKTRAFTMLASMSGSVLKSPPVSAKSVGNSGGCTISGLPSYEVTPAPVIRFLAVLMYPTESGDNPAP